MFDDVTQRGDRHIDAARMPAVGRVEAAVFFHRLRDRRGHQCRSHAAEAAGDRFRHAHDVRTKIEMLAREKLAGAAEAGRHFVGDEQGAVLPAEALQALHETLLGNEHAEVDADRLHDERGDIAPLQSPLDLVERLLVQRRFNLGAMRQKIPDALALLRVADAQAAERVAVIALLE